MIDNVRKSARVNHRTNRIHCVYFLLVASFIFQILWLHIHIYIYIYIPYNRPTLGADHCYS